MPKVLKTADMQFSLKWKKVQGILVIPAQYWKLITTFTAAGRN